VRLQAANAGGSGAVTRDVTVTAPGTPPPDPNIGPPQIVPTIPPATPQHQVKTTSRRRTVTLTAARGRGALRRVLHARLPLWRATALTCRRTSARVARCTLKARRDKRRLTATGALTLPAGSSTARYRLKVKVTGKRHASTWTGRARVSSS
jgi:hypothetical protein